MVNYTLSENDLNKKRKILNKSKLIDHLFYSYRNFENIKIAAKLFYIIIIINYLYY